MNYLTPEEVAERLQVDPAVVRKWLRNGDLKGEKIGNLWRIPEEAINYLGNKISLKEAVEIIAINRKTLLDPALQRVFEIAEAAIPNPLKKKVLEMIEKAGGLFEDGCWLGPKTGIDVFASGFLYYRLMDGDESWVDELIELYENKELEKAAIKAVNKKLKNFLVDYLIEKQGFSEEEAWKEVKGIISSDHKED